MKKVILIGLFTAVILFTVYLLSYKSNNDYTSNEYSLTFISNPGDRIDLYIYADYNYSHMGKEGFYGKEIDDTGKLSIMLPGEKYTIWARCLELSCQRAFIGPKEVLLNKDKTIQLKWSPEI